MEQNKENHAWAIKQIYRFSCMPFFPTRTEGVDALVEAFLDMVPSKEAGEWMVKEVLKREERSPSPLVMRDILTDRYRAADAPPLFVPWKDEDEGGGGSNEPEGSN